MSKLYDQYVKLKNENENTVYLFKSGIFYIALDSDAKKLSEALGFKLVNFNDIIFKCGFPQNRLSYYTAKLKSMSIDFNIIDSNYEKIENYSDYLNNNKLKEIINSVLEIDFNNITFKDSFSLMQKFQNELKEIYK